MSQLEPASDLNEPINIEALKQLFRTGPEEDAEIAVADLVSTGPPALAILQNLIGDENADLRWWVVRTLAEIDDPAADTLILRALNDPQMAIRHCAALALRKRPFPDAVTALHKALESDDALMARLAADALAAIGPPATGVLLETLESDRQLARVEAIRALANSDDLRAVPALFAALDDGSPLIEHWADVGLQRRGIGMTFFKP